MENICGDRSRNFFKKPMPEKEENHSLNSTHNMKIILYRAIITLTTPASSVFP